jgi:hypothetical protein
MIPERFERRMRYRQTWILSPGETVIFVAAVALLVMIAFTLAG